LRPAAGGGAGAGGAAAGAPVRTGSQTENSVGADLDPAAVLLGDAVDGRQAEAGAAALALGREEGVEDPRQHRGGDADAGVPHAQADEPAGLCLGRAAEVVGVGRPRLGREHQLPALGHGVARVDRQIDQDLLDHPDVGLGVGQPRLRLHLQGDVLAERPPQEPGDPVHDLPDRHPPGLEHLPAAEDEELPGQARGQLGRVPHRAEQLGDLRRQARVLQGQGNVALDDREHVVEVVGHAAGQQPDRLHLLGLAQLLLEALLLGDVPDDRDEVGLAGDFRHLAEIEALVDFPGLVPEDDPLAMHDLARLQPVDDLHAVLRPVPDPDLEGAPADQLLPGPAEVAAVGRVDVDHPALGERGDRDRVRHRPEGLEEALLRLPQRHLRRPLLRDVPDPGDDDLPVAELNPVGGDPADHQLAGPPALDRLHVPHLALAPQRREEGLAVRRIRPDPELVPAPADELAPVVAEQPAVGLVDLGHLPLRIFRNRLGVGRGMEGLVEVQALVRRPCPRQPGWSGWGVGPLLRVHHGSGGWEEHPLEAVTNPESTIHPDAPRAKLVS
jgi:hypothetical protein